MEVDSLRIALFGGIRQLEAWLDRPMLAPIELGITQRTCNGCSPILGFHVRLVTCDGQVLCIGRTPTTVSPSHLHHVCVRSCIVPSCLVHHSASIFRLWMRSGPSIHEGKSTCTIHVVEATDHLHLHPCGGKKSRQGVADLPFIRTPSKMRSVPKTVGRKLT